MTINRTTIKKEDGVDAMPSWVRYSVTVYLGLLLAGSIVLPPSATSGSQRENLSTLPASSVSTSNHTADLPADDPERCPLCPEPRR